LKDEKPLTGDTAFHQTKAGVVETEIIIFVRPILFTYIMVNEVRLNHIESRMSLPY
jgi:hypothetical protein